MNKITAIIYYRKSSKAYQKNKFIPTEDILSFFEAARWAPSANNLQPWRYIFASEDNPEEIEKMRSCLFQNNQTWASSAPLLILCCSMLTKEDGTPNTYATHDLGLANENLMLQIRSLGYNCRPMGGFDKDRAKTLFNLPEDIQPLVMIAAGYPMKRDKMTEQCKQEELKNRERNQFDQWLFQGEWGKNIDLASN